MTKVFRSKNLSLLLYCFIALLLYCYIVPSFVYAQDWLNAPLEESLKAREVAKEGEVNMESYSQKALRETAVSVSTDILGLEYVSVTPAPGEEGGYIRFNQKGALNEIGTLIAGMYANPPASFTYYAYDLLQNAGLAPKVYAQGVGFSGLTPILPLWKAFRNIAYMLLVVVLIVIGFMIMFRMKINPQTVISIQNALPRIAVTLLLITFSYAVVGLMIDLMYLSILLVASVLGKAAGWNQSTITQLQSHYTTGGLGTLFGAVFMGGFKVIDDFLKALFWSLFPGGIGGVVSLLMAIVGAVGPMGWGAWGFLAGGVPTALFILIIALSLLFIFVRLFIILLSAYIQIILAVILGPLQIVFDALPGRSGFMSWLLGIVSNLIVFPVTAAMLILGTILTTSNISPGTLGSPDKLWTPPLLGIGGTATAPAAIAFIGLGLIMLTPSIVSQAKKMFQAKPMMPMGPGTIFAPLGMATQQTLGVASQFYYAKEMFSLLGKAKEALFKEK